MDLLSEINRRILHLGTHDRVNGLKAAVRHIEVAERYLSRGRQEQDADTFNDVIYRTNQAFEGMLKEAYSILGNGGKKQLSPYEIEQHFLNKKRLTERVLGLFRNYRTQWRNPATHDHTLLFSEQEALLAIVSVSAFSLVLLDQVVETVSFKRHRAEAERHREILAMQVAPVGNEALSELAIRFLVLFSHYQKSAEIRSEAELLGSLSGFIVGLSLGIQVTPEVPLANRTVDLLLRRNGEVVVIEIEHGRASRILNVAVAQMQYFLDSSGAGAGILYFWPPAEPLSVFSSKLKMGAGEIIVVGADPAGVPPLFTEHEQRPTRGLNRTDTALSRGPAG